jgi:PAS domain S-box-containing protein
MDNELDALRRRVQELESLALEYERLSQLIDAAAQDQDMARYAGQSILQVDPATQHIIAANPAALELLGYAEADLLGMSISDLEQQGEASSPASRTFLETSVEEQVYLGLYRHRLGHGLPVQVYKRVMTKDGEQELRYRLENRSLYQRLWYELQRREDNGFKFQQKLRLLNEITIELSQTDTYDTLCRRAVQLGIGRLGFDRLSIWFLDVDGRQMVGSYGVDESGVLRDERDQRWAYDDTYITDFIAGKTNAAIAHDDSPIYNDKSEIIHYGWHIAAPILHGKRVIGVLMADNFLRRQPLKNYEPELLRLYGITVGHLTELARVREQAFALRLEQARSHMLGQFIENVGHDFRTPLAVINTKSYLLQRVDGAEQRQEMAGAIKQQVTYISTMLDRVLEFVTLENHPTLHPAPLDLHALLADVIDAQQSLITAKHLRCELVAADSPRLSADPHYLRRAVSEILDNAIRYTPDSGEVKVSAVHYPHEIGIRVQDSGVGIEKDALDKLFTPLYRIDQARVERRNGMGLAIAHAIIEAHHGRITIDSVPTQGSTFEIILPQT